MILDNGEQVFLWLGAKCSEVEIKLAYKSAQVSVTLLTKKKQVFCLFLAYLGLYSTYEGKTAR